MKLTGVLSWQEVDKIQKSPFAFSKKNFLKSFSSGGGGGEGEREGKKETSSNFNFSFKTGICLGYKFVFLVRFGMKSSGFSIVSVSFWKRVMRNGGETRNSERDMNAAEHCLIFLLLVIQIQK